jgi:rhodanese-related sulfurtransferase
VLPAGLPNGRLEWRHTLVLGDRFGVTASSPPARLPARPASSHPIRRSTPITDPDQIRQIDPTESVRLAAGAGLLDVGEPDEWAAGHAADARYIPLGELCPHELPRDRVVVAGCLVGGRSGKAAAALAAAGVDVRNIAGGTNALAAAGLAVTRDDGQSETVA